MLNSPKKIFRQRRHCASEKIGQVRTPSETVLSMARSNAETGTLVRPGSFVFRQAYRTSDTFTTRPSATDFRAASAKASAISPSWVVVGVSLPVFTASTNAAISLA